jgi:hypothetical protein
MTSIGQVYSISVRAYQQVLYLSPPIHYLGRFSDIVSGLEAVGLLSSH